jgi:hydrogenase assembly chaperone HypC/HupF
VCITFPGRVREIVEFGALVEIDGQCRRASTLLQPTVAVDDWVLVGAGTILRRLDAAEAAELTRILTAARASTDARPAAGTPGGHR